MCEVAKVYDEDLVIARKEHQCCECRLPIEKGERHWRCSGLWDTWQTYRQHIHCCRFARELNHGNHNWIDGWESCKVPMIPGSPYSGEMSAIVDYARRFESRNVNYNGAPPDECIPFGGVKESLYDYDDGDIKHQWDAMISGINEKFSCGSGI